MFIFSQTANALITGTAHSDITGAVNFYFDNGLAGSAYNDIIGHTNYVFNDGTTGYSYTDLVGATHYNLFNNNIKNLYSDSSSRCNMPSYFLCRMEEDYQKIYEQAKQGLPTQETINKSEFGYLFDNSSIEEMILSGIYGSQLKICREHIDSYQKSKTIYEDCLKNEEEKYKKWVDLYFKAIEQKIKYDAELFDLQKEAFCVSSYGTSSLFNKTNKKCECKTGFLFDSKSSKCLAICPEDSSRIPEGCQCNRGLIWNKDWTECITCEAKHPNSHYDYNNGKCLCENSFFFNKVSGKCEIKTETESKSTAIDENQILETKIIKDDKSKNNLKTESAKIDKVLSKRVNGKLLLQVEDRGNIWYVDTKEFKRYSVTWANALALFRKLSLGITDADLAKIPISGSNEVGNNSIRNRLKGKLLLQVQQGGAIWFVDKDGYRHSVTWNNLMDLFRKLALGITNADLSKVEVGSLE